MHSTHASQVVCISWTIKCLIIHLLVALFTRISVTVKESNRVPGKDGLFLLLN